MAVLIQESSPEVYFQELLSVAIQLTQQDDTVVIEALPGDATQVVSGHVTPEQYRVFS